jgi:uncharacterized cupredoxin-like copper-binding protein
MGARRAWKVVGAVAALAVLAAGCGDDDDEAADTGGGGDTEEFCDIARELDEQEDFPSVEQLEEYRDSAPEEIREEAETVTAAFIEATEAGDVFAAFEDPAVEEAFGVIEPFETEECGIEHSSEDEDEEPDQDASVTSLDPAATQVDVVATEYAFDFEAPTAAGRYSFVMANEGEERHVMYLFRPAEGQTVQDLLDADGEAEPAEDWESESVTSGEEAVLTADLAAGEYAMICYIQSPEGESHYDLGMQETFTVQ